LVLKCLSNIIIVIKPANTGILIISNIEVKNIDQQYRGIYRIDWSIVKALPFKIVTIKFIEPSNELKPAICKLKNNKSIDEWFNNDNGI